MILYRFLRRPPYTTSYDNTFLNTPSNQSLISTISTVIMRFTAVLAASASLITLGYAADPLAFTSWPADVSAGKPVTLTWAGGVPDQVIYTRPA